MRRFVNNFHEWRSHEWKLLANRFTSDPKMFTCIYEGIFMFICLYMYVCASMCVYVFILGRYRFCFLYILNYRVILLDRVQRTLWHFEPAFHGVPCLSGTPNEVWVSRYVIYFVLWSISLEYFSICHIGHLSGSIDEILSRYFQITVQVQVKCSSASWAIGYVLIIHN